MATGGNLLYDSAGGVSITTGTLGLGVAASSSIGLHNSLSVTASAGIGVLNWTDGTLTAAANGDALVENYLGGATFAKGAYTGLQAYGMWLRGSVFTSSGAGTINNAFGIYIDTPTIGTANYPLYVADGTSCFIGNLVIGGIAAGTTANRVLALSNSATAPTNSPDLAQLYSADISAGNATLAVYTETAVAADVGLASTHSLTVFLNGAKYKLMLVAV